MTPAQVRALVDPPTAAEPAIAAAERLALRHGWHHDGPPAPRRPGWRDRLDARISRCPGCDGLQWDGACRRCFTRETTAVDNPVLAGAETGLTWDNGRAKKRTPGSLRANPEALATATEEPR